MRRLLMLPMALLVMAAVDLPDEGPVPAADPRPAEVRSPAGADAAADPDAAPDDEAGRAEDATPPVLSKPAPIAVIPPPAPLSVEKITACEAELTRLGAVFERRDPIEAEGGCGVPQPYNLREPVAGVILKPATNVTCPVALATARWVRDVVQPAVRALGEGVTLAEITHASSYVCRSRNNQPGAKISEHAHGNAIDINGFDLDGRAPLPVIPRRGNGNIDEAFQRAVQAGACLYFTTVLGPGSDPFHDDHLHLDLAERRSGYRLCQ